MRQFQNIPTLNATGNEENILKFSLTKYHVHFKHLKLPICIKIPVILPQIVYICMTAVSPNSIS